MRGRMIVIKPGSDSLTSRPLIEERPLTGPPEYEEIKKALDGGQLEPVPYFSRYDGQQCVAFVDKYGKTPMSGLPRNYNATATALWMGQVGDLKGDYLVGNVVIICGDVELLRGL